MSQSEKADGQFEDGEIQGVVIRTLRQFEDARGWLTELYREDEVDPAYHPVMAYISSTRPDITRGPHEHVAQADLFAFVGPSNFRLYLWDNREAISTYRRRMIVDVGESNPATVLIPPGVVHAYKNIGDVDGWVINCANRLYCGEGRQEAADEIRHERDPETIYRVE